VTTERNTNPWKHQSCSTTHPILDECPWCVLEKSWDGGFNECNARGVETQRAKVNKAYDEGYSAGNDEGYAKGCRDGLEDGIDDADWDALLDEMLSNPAGVVTSPPR
jgi:flagellar biosynthesis/type III secretory pathway protein FliH